MSFLSDASYRDFLEEHIRTLPEGTAKAHVREKYELWRRQYRAARLVERAAELLAAEKQRPSALYLRGQTDLDLLHLLARGHYFDPRAFRGFLVADPLWESLKPEWFAPFPVHRAGDWRDGESTAVFTFSDSAPFRNNGSDRGNDYIERFIDLSRLSAAAEIRRRLAGRRTVLYVDYRKVQTLAALSEQVRRSSDLATVLLVDAAATGCRQEFDAVIEEPFPYLWPLVLQHLGADVVHVNVGWGTQGLPFAPFVGADAIIDFYDLLTFVADESLRKGHPEPVELTRASERTLCSNFKHIVHRCSDDITTSLRRTYPGRDIVSVTEYLREPVYVSEPVQCDGTVRLVYGGLLVRAGAGESDPHYQNFIQMVKYYCRGNLHLYLYPSPYLYGFGPPKGVEELVQRLGLDNVHGCMPLEESEFVREIAQYDFGMCLPTPEDIRPTSYGYILPAKFITYLRAGLPLVVPEDQTFIADLVRDNDIGVVYGYDDHERMADLLNSQDIGRLKRNVVRFRERFRIEKAAEKVIALYNTVPGATETTGKPEPTAPVDAAGSVLACKDRDSAAVHSFPSLLEKLNRCGFVSAAEYQNLLHREIERDLSDQMRAYATDRFRAWFEAYGRARCLSRLLELVKGLGGASYHLYLDDPARLNLVGRFLEEADSAGLARPAAFIVDHEVETLKAQLAPYRVLGVTDPVPSGHAVVCFSAAQFPGRASQVLANDYLERFIDARRFRGLRAALAAHQGKQVVLYPMYREIHTVSIMARFVRQKDEQVRTVSLAPKPLLNADFDTAMVEPFLYLWPLVFRLVDPDLVHLNVGWGIQALALSPFIPDRRRTVVDFYEVLSFLPDAYFEKTHSSAAEVRAAEEHFCTKYDHIIHLCCDEISTKLASKYDHHGDIVSVTEYLEKPAYSRPMRNDGAIRLVYGGCMLATTSPDDLYYQAFVKVAPHFTRENLHLYIYNSPYVHGIVENDALKEVIRTLGLTNIHACTPRKLDDFVREISEYDYGVTLLRPKDMGAAEYNYFLATKFLTYLRAGLPVVIDADNRFMAGLVERYGLGVVLHDRDLENLPAILNGADLPTLKRNVAKFRAEFSIEKGGEKVLTMYHDILRGTVRSPQTDTTTESFEEMIASMARAENRLYYRDQSAHTLLSLLRHAREVDPSVIVELGTLAGLSLRTWVGATPRAKIYAIDLSFKKLHETRGSLPLDLSRVNLLEQDILQTDLAALWAPQDRVILFVDAHDLPGVPIMTHVLATALPALPDGSLVIVDDLWYSEQRLTRDNARGFLEERVLGQIDELQCFAGHYGPYHAGGSFMGFAEVVPLLKFVNERGIRLTFDKIGKHVSFIWKQAYLSGRQGDVAAVGAGRADEFGCVPYHPLDVVPVSPSLTEQMSRIATDYRSGRLREAVESLSQLRAQHPHDEGPAYGLAVCLARGGMLAQARDVLAQNLRQAHHPRYRRLLDDLIERVGPAGPGNAPEPRPAGVTVFAMPKSFSGHVATIQKNAIRSWARLRPQPEIILFGDEPGVREMAQEVGARHVGEVDRNEFGTPLVNKLFQAAEAHASNPIMAYVNADMILLQDFIHAVQTVQEELLNMKCQASSVKCHDTAAVTSNFKPQTSNFLLIGQRWDLPLVEEIDFDQPDWQGSLGKQKEEHAMLHAECGLDYFVFPKGLYREIPPFAIGRTAWDNWLVMAPHEYGAAVIDGTQFITAVHQDHDYGHMAGGRHEAWNGVEAARNRALAGVTDNSGRTTGATWALNQDGTLARMQPRRPWHLTAEYKERRSAWLLKQAQRLSAAAQYELAACKCEESVAFLHALLQLNRQGGTHAETLDFGLVAKRYAASCTLLAQCRLALGLHDQVAAAYTLLLDHPLIQIPPAQREEMVRLRGQLIQASRPERQSPSSSAPVGLASSLVPPFADTGTHDSLRPKVSVVTACRNGEQHLRECLDSVLRQTMPQWELLVLDDGSMDDTRRIMEDYAQRDPRVRAFYFDDSAGPYVRRNFGIAHANAEFIVIQDADDVMAPEKLERLHHAITRDERLGIVGSFYRMFLDDHLDADHAEDVTLATEHEQILEEYRLRAVCDYCWHGSAVIRKRLFEDLGPYDENPFASDSFWLAKAAEYACRSDEIRLQNIPEFLTWRRMRTDSQTGSLPAFDPRGRRAMFKDYRRNKLSEALAKLDADSSADAKAVLRRSVCNDFIRTHEHLFETWESRPPTSDIAGDFLARIFAQFAQGQFVRCIVTCGIVERLVKGIAQEVRSYDLVRGLAYFALGLPEESRALLEREIGAHGTAIARELCVRFLDRYDAGWSRADREAIVQDLIHGSGPSARPGSSTVVCSADHRGDRAVELSVVVPDVEDAALWAGCMAAFNAQSEKSFEVIVLGRGGHTPQTDGVHFDLAVLNAADAIGPWQYQNAAVGHARGRYIAFLEEGVLPEPDFVRNVVGRFRAHDINGLRGRIISDSASGPLCFDLGPEALYAACDTDEMCAFRKDVFVALGGFSEAPLAHGAIQLSYRIYTDRQIPPRPMLYCPEVVVRYAGRAGTGARLVDRFALEHHFCLDHLRRAGLCPEGDEYEVTAFLRFVGSLYGLPTRTDEDRYERSLDNSLFFERRFPAVALEWAQTALTERPDSVKGRYAMGASYARLDQSQRACTFLEQILDPLERLLALRRLDRARSDFRDYANVGECYTASCTLLAQCYLKLGRQEDVAAIYTHLLDNRNVRIPEAQRQAMKRLCDRLPAPRRAQAQPLQAGAAHGSEPPAAFLPERAEGVSPAEPVNGHEDGLAGLEVKYRSLPSDAPIKQVAAVRLSELYRRTGQPERAQAYAIQARKIGNGAAFERAGRSKPSVCRHRPTIVEFNVISRCNAGCIMCNYGPQGDILDLDRFQRLADELLPTAQRAMLIGGEVLLHPEFYRICEYAGRFGVSLGMTTNLCSPADRWADAIRRFFHVVRVSVDAATEQTYESIRTRLSFKRLQENLRTLAEIKRQRADLKLELAFAAMRQNVAELPDTIEMVGRLGFDSVAVSFVQIDGRLTVDDSLLMHRERANRYFDLARDKARAVGLRLDIPNNFDLGREPFVAPETPTEGHKQCLRPWQRVRVLTGGDVIGCCHLHGLPMGNAFTESFERIWNGPKYAALREAIARRDERLPDRCKHCRMLLGPADSNDAMLHVGPDLLPALKQRLDKAARGPDGDRRPKVTVVTACRNSERFLAESLESVRAQSLREWELLLLDDGSTDGTRRLIAEYAHHDCRIKPFCFDTSAGPYVRRNFAIERAAADFIVIHDSDDLMAPEKLQKLYDEISGDSRLAMVGSSYGIFYENFKGLQYTDSVELPLDHEQIVEQAATWGHAISHGAAIIRKSMFQGIGPYDENPFTSDAFWSAKLAEYSRHDPSARFRNVPEYLTLCRIHGVSQTQVLSLFDPRNRRFRYRGYCECKLRRIREKMRSVPGVDIGRELRECRCCDFLTRFQAQIVAWENEPLDPRVLENLLDSAAGAFRAGRYVTCANILNNVEAMEPGISERVEGFDLLKRQAFDALGIKDRGLTQAWTPLKHSARS